MRGPDPEGPVVEPRVEREVDEEFAFHLEMRVRELMAAGMPEGRARVEAERRFGDMERVKATCRDLGTRRRTRMSRRAWWDEVRQDVRFAIRQLGRAPSFAAMAILTLAVAIGANSAVFSVVNAVWLAPLPYDEPDELVAVWTRYLPPSGFDIPEFAISGPEVLDLRDEARTLSSLAPYTTSSVALTGDGRDAERVRVTLASADLWSTLGVHPFLGRWFSAAEDVPDGPRVALLAHGVWTRRYGADPDLVGRTVEMDGIPTDVVGVMPPDFEFAGAEVFLPLRLDRQSAGGRAGHGLGAVGRLAPGSSLEDVHAELAIIADRWAAEYEHNVAHFPFGVGLKEDLIGDASQTLAMLMTAVGLVLLIACANVANLLLARGERRNAEVAVRTALGAGSGRITRQLVTESLVLAGIAALLGLGVGHAAVRVLVALDPSALPRLDDVALDTRVLAFTGIVAVLTALLFGVVPARTAGRRAVKEVAGFGSRSTGHGRSRLRRLLIGCEVALSVVVVIMAGLVARSFRATTSQDPGLDPSNVLTFSVTLTSARYPDELELTGAFASLLERLEAMPGVTGATAASSLPFAGGFSRWDFQLDDRPPRQEGDLAWNAGVSIIAPDYFRTLRIPVLEGRTMGERDTREAQPVAVVSESMARTYWPGESALDKRFGYQQTEDSISWATVVGVVPDRYASSVTEDVVPHVFLPQGQAGMTGYYWPRTMTVALRTSLEPERIVPGVRAEVARFDPDLPLDRVRTMEEYVASSVSTIRVTTNLLGSFALIALALAVVGIYGVVSYSVAGRTREIGVRVALGAERGRVLRLILREGSTPILLGLALGTVAASFSARLLESLLHGIQATDPLTFTAVPLTFLVIAAVASWIPASRATRIPPTVALRED